jgi:outer membrane protein insertion porin family
MKQRASTICLASAITVCATSLTPSTAHAGDSVVVTDIRLDGLKRIEAGTLLANLPIKRGDTFTDDKASQAVRAIYDTGLFSDVNVSLEGDVVVVHVVERPAIAEIDFSGIHEFEKDNLTKALRAVGLSRGRPFDKALIDKAEQELKRQYLTRGYYAAQVETTTTPVDSGRVSVLFSVIEGVFGKHAARRNGTVDAELVFLVHEERSLFEREARRRSGSPALVLSESRLSGVQDRFDSGVADARQEGDVSDAQPA